MHARPGMFDMRSSSTETTFDDKDMIVSMATKHYNRFSESTLSSRQLDATSQDNEIDDKIPLTVLTEQEEYWNYASGVFQNRRAFVTDNGLLGHGPDIAEPGDVVAVMVGLPSPCILRPRVVYDSHAFYKLVVDAYVSQLSQACKDLKPTPIMLC
jgi:hypothetical protein